MRLIYPSTTIETTLDYRRIIESIAWAARTCYKSENKSTHENDCELVKSIIKRGHLSVLEHESIRVRFVIDRGVSHELVRHRICTFSQESTRYCEYKGQVTFIIPPWTNIQPGEYDYSYEAKTNTQDKIWFDACLDAETRYKSLLNMGWQPQQARSVLPNSLKTEIVITANLREWRHIFRYVLRLKRIHK